MRVLLALTCVVAFTTAAHAECAWVLWEHVSSSGQANTTSTEPVAAHDTRAECQTAIVAALAGFKSSPGLTVRKDDKLHEAYVTTMSKSGSASTTGYRYVCLPDTVDPR